MARFASWLTPQSWRHSTTKRRLEHSDMPSAFPLLEQNRQDAVAVAHPAASVVVQGDASFADLFGRNAMLLRPVAVSDRCLHYRQGRYQRGVYRREQRRVMHRSAGNLLRARTALSDHRSHARYLRRCPC